MKKKGWPVKMHIMQGVAHSMVPVWLNACDVLLVTSLTEGSINIVKEALGCNVPVVSVDVGDVAERLQGINGCYICDADPESIAYSIERVFSGQGSVLGRVKMKEITVKKIAYKILNFYKEIKRNKNYVKYHKD